MKTSAKKILMLSILNLAVFSAVAFMLGKIENDRIDLTALQTNEVADLNKIQDIAMLEKNMAINEDNIVKIDSYFVGQATSTKNDKEGTVKFVKEVEALALKEVVALGVQSIDKEDVKDNTQSKIVENLKLKIKVTGVWKNSLDFISALVSMPYKIKVTNVSMSVIGGPTTATVGGKKIVKDANWDTYAEFFVAKIK